MAAESLASRIEGSILLNTVTTPEYVKTKLKIKATYIKVMHKNEVCQSGLHMTVRAHQTQQWLRELTRRNGRKRKHYIDEDAHTG